MSQPFSVLLPLTAMFRFSFTLRSSNRKTGPIPVTRTDRTSCPATCPFKGNGCYAATGPEAIHWGKLDREGLSFEQLLEAIRTLPDRQLWRHNSAGDLPNPATVAGRRLIKQLAMANLGKRGFTYSHHRLTAKVAAFFKAITAWGFTINASTESETAADAAVAHGVRTVMAVPSTETRRFWRSAGGNRVVVCPAVTYPGKVTCATCQLCYGRDSQVIIAFPAHGTHKRKADSAIAAAQP